MDDLKVKKLEASLSNERTLLSYIRTSAAVIVLAVALFKFFTNANVIIVGILTLIAGLTIFFLGIWRYIQEKRRIQSEQL